MNAKQEKAKVSGTGTILTFSLTIFVLSFAWTIYAIFKADIVFLSAVFTFLEDSSGFLTFLCIVMIAVSLLRSQKQYHIAILNAINIVLLNQLYLNSQWQALYESVRKFLSEYWATVLVLGLLFIVAGYCIYVGWKQRRKDLGQRPNTAPTFSPSPPAHIGPQQVPDGTAPHDQNTAPQNSNSEVKALDPTPEQAPDAQNAPPSGSNAPNRTAAPGQSDDGGTASVTSILLGTCFAVIAAYIGKVLVFDVWKASSPLESLGTFFNVLPILAVLSASVIISLTICKILQSVGKTFRYDNFRTTALLAILLEFGIILVAVLNDGNKFPDFLDDFLNGVVKNNLIALPLILVAMFIILDIFISVILKITLGKNSHDWIAQTEERIVLIEQGLTIFVCNLMIGFINLLLFIPDFFNQIGQLLLDEDDFFPQEKIKIKKLTLEKKDVPPTEHNPGSAGPTGKETTDEGTGKERK